MVIRVYKFVAVTALLVVTACSGGTGANNSATSNSAPVTSAPPAATPSKAISTADVGKLKWIEGAWRGMDGEKPFYERYRFEGSTMVVETLADETLAKVEETSRFELKDGEFGSTQGERRSAAAWISDNAVQFVPAAGGGNSFRFEKQSDDSWNAVLEWPASQDKPARQKIYKMERWPKK